jgi:hypothetical protein
MDCRRCVAHLKFAAVAGFVAMAVNPFGSLLAMTKQCDDRPTKQKPGGRAAGRTVKRGALPVPRNILAGATPWQPELAGDQPGPESKSPARSPGDSQKAGKHRKDP